MSTNKTLKRIALVAVASLGFGLVSVAPSNAADVAITAGKVTAITLATVTAAPAAGSAVDVNMGVATTATAADATPNLSKANFVGVVTSYPAGAFAQVTASKTAAGTDTLITGEVDASAVVADNVLTVKGADNTAFGGNTVTASSTAGVAKFSFTPSVAGTYVLTVWHDADAGSDIDINETQNQISITVSAAAVRTPSSTYSTIGDWTATSASKVAGTDMGNAVTVTVKDGANTALNGQTIRAVVSGPGTVKLTNAAAGTVTGRDVSLATAANENTVTLLLEADGTAGKSTVDVYAGTTKILTSASVLWYGTLATLKVEQKKSVVTKNAALTAAVVISGLDADGNAVPLADNTVVGTSSDATVLVTKDNDDDAVTDGVITLQVTAANDVTTTSGRTATMTWKYLISGTTYTPDVVTTFTVGGALASATITFDKTTYAPGEKVTATITAKDSSGNAAGDATVFAAIAGSPTLASTVAVQGMTTAAIATVGGTATTTFYAPATSGTFSVSGSATIAGVATTITSSTATVVSAAEETAAAAADAAAEAIDAANAATDAANLAAEAADAATVAAEEARDAADAATAAVEELATQVATLMAALKAQITTLANTVAKIAKKVRA